MGHYQSECTHGSSSSPKQKAAGSIAIQSILPDELVQLGITHVPGNLASTILIRSLPDS